MGTLCSCMFPKPPREDFFIKDLHISYCEGEDSVLTDDNIYEIPGTYQARAALLAN